MNILLKLKAYKIIRKPKHSKEEEYKEQDERTRIQKDEKTTLENEP